MKRQFPVVWLTGNSGAGKTSLAFGLKSIYDARAESAFHRRVVVLDGDEMRASISEQETFTKESRRSHNLRVARLATVLRDQGFLVIVAVIAPFADVRSEIDAVCSPVWIHVKRTQSEHPDRPYEPPNAPFAVMDHDSWDLDTALVHAQKSLETLLAD